MPAGRFPSGPRGRARLPAPRGSALAEELGIGVVLVPESAGVLSALGLVAGDERRDRVLSYVRPLADVSGLPAEGEADLRYRGQSFELTVPLQDDLAGAFHRAHAE